MTEFEQARRSMLRDVNAVTQDNAGGERSEADVRADLEREYGRVWTTAELQEEFTVLGFAAPLVVAVRNDSGHKGTLMFTHMPRFYHSWEETGNA